MIQRIQTLYLLFAVVALAFTLFSPIATLFVGEAEMTLSAFRISDAANGSGQSLIYMGVLVAISFALPLLTIFLYKHRKLQIRLCGAEIVLLLGDIAFEIIYCLLAVRAVSGAEFSDLRVRVGAVMPLVAIILVIMAMRAIFRDEVLVRSLDRIR